MTQYFARSLVALGLLGLVMGCRGKAPNRAVGPSSTSSETKLTQEGERLAKHRTLMLVGTIDDEAANRIVAQLLFLDSVDSKKSITIRIDSKGGSVTAALAIHDTIRFVKSRVDTTCIGECSGAALLLLAAGSPGHRSAVPNARMDVMPLASKSHVQGDFQQVPPEVLRVQDQYATLLRRYSSLDSTALLAAQQQGKSYTAIEAKQLGLIDAVLSEPPPPIEP